MAESYIGGSCIVWPTTLIHSASLTLDSGASCTAGLVREPPHNSADGPFKMQKYKAHQCVSCQKYENYKTNPFPLL